MRITTSFRRKYSNFRRKTNNFKRKFNKNLLYLPELEVIVSLPLGSNCHIGFVGDVEESSRSIYKQYGANYPPETKTESESRCIGTYLRFKSEEIKLDDYFILIDEKLDLAQKINSLCHQYGHLIWDLDQQDSIYRKLEDSELIRSKVNNGDDFAILCGYLGLRMAGYHPTKKVPALFINNDLMNENSIQKHSVLEHHLIKNQNIYTKEKCFTFF